MPNDAPHPELPPPEVLRHVVDVHCHPTDATDELMNELDITLGLMSMHQDDQKDVYRLAKAYPDKVVPHFGYHPWFSHFISLTKPISKEEHYKKLFLLSDETSTTFDELLPHLPDPIFLGDALDNLRELFHEFPNAHLGEVGVDKPFRVPHDYYASPRVMTDLNIPMAHQIAVLEAQMDLAVELQRNVSMHSVRAQMPTMDLLTRMAQRHGDKWRRISIDMHSCGMSAQMWRDLERKHTNVFLSVSVFVNRRSPNYAALIEACSPNRILVESDLNELDDCVSYTWDMLTSVAKVRDWPLEQAWQDNVADDAWGAVRRLEQNWKSYLNGNHPPLPERSSKRRMKDFFVEESDDEQ